MTKGAGSPGDPGSRERLLTVARVRRHPDHAEVMFFEMARICRLPLGTPESADALRLLDGAIAARKPVRVRFLEEHGGVIEGVRGDDPGP